MSLRDPEARRSAPDFLTGGGEMGALMRSHDWSTSPLGSPETWPQSLRAVVALMINSRYPMFVAWGPELAFLYNDGYRPIFGKKHPHALGLPFREVWSEIWNDVRPLVDRALAGDATFNENMHLVMERNGFPEDTWYSFSYSPVRDESGAVAGMFCACTETTRDVLAERRKAAERERLARMFEQAPGFITILQGPEHVFEFANAAYRRVFGDRDFVGKPAREAFPEVVGQGFIDLLDRVYTTGERFVADRVPIRLERRDGPPEERFLDFIYEPVTDEAGRVTGIFCEGHDVTDQHRAEAELRESEEFNRRILQSSADCIKVLNLDGRLEFMSEGGMCTMEVDDFASVAGACWPDFWAGDERAMALAAIEEAKRGGAGRFQGLATTHKGTPRWWDVAVTPINGPDGRPERLLAVSRDVTAVRQAEAARRESETRLRLAIEGARLGTWDWDLQTATGSWSPRTMEILGVDSGDDITPQQRTEIIHPDDRERVWREFAEALQSRTGLVSDYRIVRADGEVRWIVSRGALETDGEGVPTRASGIVLDVTERFAAEARLRESETRFRILLETAPALIFATDAQGRNSFVNERYQRYTGRSFDELCGDGWQAVVHPDDRSAALAESIDMQARPRPIERRMRIRRHDGEWRWFLSRTEPVVGGGDTEIRWLGVSIDIEEQVRAEERERLLAQEVDHRAKNLLAVVQSVVQLTRADDADTFKAAVNGRIQALARSHGLLAAARWEGVDLATLVEEELAAFAGRSAGAVRIDGPAIRLKPAAAQSLGLVLHELATNAVKHGSLSVAEGQLEVSWSLANIERGQRQLKLQWRESGGPEVAPAATRGFGSTVIRTSVERQLKGKVTMAWRPEGLVCELILPAEQLGAARASAAHAEKPLGPAQDVPRQLGGLPVLVVEDEVLIAMQIEDAVVQAGGVVVGPAASVAEAVDLVVGQTPAAAILDVNLGSGERSFPVADILMAKNIPFAFCTGYAGVADLPERFRGATVLAKPLDQAVLVQTLERLVAAPR